MSAWEEEFKRLVKPVIAHRYELRPNEKGVYIFCTTCGSGVSHQVMVNLSDIVREANAHEELNHSGHQSATGSDQKDRNVA